MQSTRVRCFVPTIDQKHETRRQQEQEQEEQASGYRVHEFLHLTALKECSEKLRSVVKIRQTRHGLGSL